MSPIISASWSSGSSIGASSIDELEQLRKQMRGDYHFHTMVSKSPRIRKVFDLIEQVGPIGSTVLIQGETGTGKELVAQASTPPTRAAPGRSSRSTAPS